METSKKKREKAIIGQKTFFHRLARLDEILAALCLITMIVIVLVQIFLRNFFQTGIGGADPLVRHLVLWVVFLGAGLASKDNSHIKIDFLSKYLPDTINKIIDFIVAVFSTCILGILVYASSSFVKMEFSSDINIPLLNIPAWMAEIIIPLGYLIIGLHVLVKAFGLIHPEKTGRE